MMKVVWTRYRPGMKTKSSLIHRERTRVKSLTVKLCFGRCLLITVSPRVRLRRTHIHYLMCAVPEIVQRGRLQRLFAVWMGGGRATQLRRQSDTELTGLTHAKGTSRGGTCEERTNTRTVDVQALLLFHCCTSRARRIDPRAALGLEHKLCHAGNYCSAGPSWTPTVTISSMPELPWASHHPRFPSTTEIAAEPSPARAK